MRKRVWRRLGGPGIVLVRGRAAALWRPAKKGERLVVTIEPLAKLTAAAKGELAKEAERVAPFRGAASAQLDWT